MTRFYTDSIALTYSNVEAAKQWWVSAFECTVAKIPLDWDNPLPSDVALKLPGGKEPTILLSDRSEVKNSGFNRTRPLASVLFCDKLQKAHDQLSSRGIQTGSIQDGGDMQFFEVRDSEGNLIQICKES